MFLPVLTTGRATLLDTLATDSLGRTLGATLDRRRTMPPFAVEFALPTRVDSPARIATDGHT
jgi:hypothetical protein